ncbi:LysR family transcriptional regulator [Devosia nitrariae]|nr:LysR family transcriptional regulator [Devosia nitrariae]
MNLLFRFRTIAEAGSIRAAAESLNITQPALSRSLNLLEAHYRQPLMERHARGVRPTAFGHKLLSTVSRMSREWELAELDLAAEDISVEGVLRINGGPLWTSSVLPVVATRLQERFPNLTLEIGYHTGELLLDDLMQGRVDVALGGFPRLGRLASQLVAHQFTSVRDRIVARADHPIHQCKPDDYAAILAYPWIVFSADPIYGAQTQHAVVERTGMSPNIRIRSTSLLAIIRLLQEGDYLCMLPAAAVTELHGPQLRPAPVEVGRVVAASGALYLKSIAHYEPLRVLIDLCTAYFEEQQKEEAA